MLTGDENIVEVDFSVFWQVKVPKEGENGVKDYLFNIQAPEGTVKAVAESAMREEIGRSQIEVTNREDGTTAYLHAKLVTERAKENRKLRHGYSSLDPFSSPSGLCRSSQPMGSNTSAVPITSMRLVSQESKRF